jgi:hypothetical protein
MTIFRHGQGSVISASILCRLYLHQICCCAGEMTDLHFLTHAVNICSYYSMLNDSFIAVVELPTFLCLSHPVTSRKALIHLAYCLA